MNNTWTSDEIDAAKADLLLAGWVPKTSMIWKAPNGSLHLGPAGAWRTMKRAQNDEAAGVLAQQRATFDSDNAAATSDANDWINCAICRQQNSFSGIGHWAWHRFCRSELNPIALISRIEQQRLGEGGDAIVRYVVAVTGMDLDAARAAMVVEGKASDARLTDSEEGKANGSATKDLT